MALLIPTVWARHSGRVLDVAGGSLDSGARIIQWGYHGGGNQRFRPEPLGDGSYRLIADHSGKVLDIEGGSTDSGAGVIQWDWHGGPNQRFLLEPVGDGYYRIVAQHSGKVLDVAGASMDAGAEIIQWDWHGGDNQRFRLLSGVVFAHHSGAVLDVAGGSTDPGAPIIQWDLHGGPNQQFRLEPLEDGFYRIVAENSGKVFDVEGGSTDSGARIIQWDWHSGPNQRFQLDPVGGDEYRLIIKSSGKVLDIAGGSNAPGAQLIQWDWHGGDNQRFRLFATGFRAEHSGKMLDVAGASMDSGAALIQWDSHGGANQRFRPEPLGDGSFRIVPEHSGKVLDVAGGSGDSGAPIIQWDWHGGPNQRFSIEPLGGGAYRIVSRSSGKVLDVAGGSGDSGATVIQWDWHGGPNQRWRFNVPALFVRREAWALASSTTFDPITLGYANAVKVMQARPASDPTSWSYQAAIHATFAAPPPGAPWNACQHQSWFFLPWHRMYLYFFERIVRKAVLDAGGPADFALPYWNYDRPLPGNTLPLAYRTPTLPDGTANPLFVGAPQRSAALMSGGQVPDTATSDADAMANTDFSLPSFLPTFGGGRVGPAHFGGALGLLEMTPHNVMHPTIGGSTAGQCAGGLMTDPRCAALDPIFWLHHANIDRLWNKWLRLGGGRANPTEAAWLTQSFEFRDETGATVTLTGADVVDSAAQLGYTYDDVSEERAGAVMMSRDESTRRPPPRAPELVGATETPLVLVGQTASVSLTVPQSSHEMVEGAARERAQRLFVTVEDIEAQQDPGVAYAVYLEGPSGGREHIGNVSLFGIQDMNDPDRPHQGAPGFRHAFDVTGAVNALREQGAFNPTSVSITFEPIRIIPAPGEEARAAAEAREAAAPVSIGRVGLFVA